MELLRTWSATTLLPVCHERAWSELGGLLEALWPGATEELDAVPAERLVHAVLEGGEPDVWLTWTLEGLPCGATRVRLDLDEVAGDAPDPDLDRLLVALLSRCAPTLHG